MASPSPTITMAFSNQSFCLVISPNFNSLYYKAVIYNYKPTPMATSRFIAPSSLNSLQINFYCQSRAQTRGLVVHGGLHSGGPLPPETPPSSWLNTTTWILGAMLTIVLPFLRHKRRPLFTFSKEAEAVVETAERVAEVIEDVAKEVAGELPGGGRLGHAIEFIKNVANETAKDAL